MKFPLARFNTFCSELVIDSKELGQITLAKQLGTQRYAIEQTVRGLEDGIHFFVNLKGRQFGITTIYLALDLFWHYCYPGMQGTLAADSEENRDMFRSTLTMFHEGLPRSHRVRLVQNNRNFLSFKNRSRIMMQIGGGGKKKGGKGRGKGLIYIHGTEISSWEDEESLASILASLAQENPLRLALWESTARGFNLFHDIWTDAKNATTQRAIFIGWWRNELYRKEKGSNEYRVYWDGQMTPQEREWVRAVKLMYGYEIATEQLAWFRWMSAEMIHDDNLMMQEFPPTEEHAFILTGKNFFSLPRVQEIRNAIDEEPEPAYYRFKFGDEFMDTELDASTEKMAQLTIYEEPDDLGFYSIGADPAYGSANWADRFAIEVYRCYADRFEQVAEFCTAELTTYKFAWIICYLAGAYKNNMVNLEINGPGEAVLAEMNNLRRQAGMSGRTPEGRALSDVVGHMSYYLYRRLDSPGGAGVYMWKTTAQTKERALNGFRDMVERGEAVLHSPTLTDEMKIIVRDDGFLGATGRKKDDCTIASAIAAVQHIDFIRTKMMQMGEKWEKERARRAQREVTGAVETPSQAAAGRSVSNYMERIGMKYGKPDGR